MSQLEDLLEADEPADLLYTSAGEEEVDNLLCKYDGIAPQFSQQEALHHLIANRYAVGNRGASIANKLRQLLMQGQSLDKKGTQLLDNSLDLLLEGFYKLRKGSHQPAMMSLPGHYLVEHSLHTLMVLNAIGTHHETKVSVARMAGALLHDFKEDTDMDYKSIAEKMVAGTSQQQEAFQASLGILRTTIRKGSYYVNGIELLFAELEPENSDLQQMRMGLRKYVPDWSKDHQEGITIAMLAKVSDKISAVQTLDGFTPEKRLRTLGKALVVLNSVREYAASNEVPDIICYFSNVLAYEMRQSVRRELGVVDTIVDKYRKTHSWMEHELANSSAKRDEYILEHDGLKKFDTPPTDDAVDSHSHTAYYLNLTAHSFNEAVSIPAAFKRQKESDNAARKRLLAQQTAFRETLPGSISNVVDRKSPKSERESNELIGQLMKWCNYDARLRVLDSATAKYAIEERFYLKMERAA